MKVKKLIIAAALAAAISFTACIRSSRPAVNTETPDHSGMPAYETAEPTDAPAPEVATGSIAPEAERILGGEPLPLDFSALISDGMLIDIDGDGEKEHLTAKRGEPAGRFNLLVDAEETDIWLDAATEASFISLFGDTIQLGVDETEPYSMLRDYLYLNGEAEQPTPERGVSVMCIAPAQNKWKNNSSSLFFPDTSVRELPRFASIEECIEAGASADLHFPLMSSIDENNDVSLELDLDGDGIREKLLLKAGRILVYSPDDPSEPVFEVPYAPSNEEKIVARYVAEGYEVYAAPCFEYFVNGVRCDLFDGENGASSLHYESSICFAKGPNGGIMLLALYGGYNTIEYKNGSFSVSSISSGENT